ncbi:ankyrin [Choiromyces venosus 120613-1]|uniref:Ankyrin n=1 Tax=Choiromyces venosus 120613-1 TaxID=1336337 RepID=A0A3N4JDW9_9PEZI|nr:ankyrin [Choiromyces venosus 120613-1]
MPFLALPNELLLEICTSPALEIPDIASVLRANHFLRDLLARPLRSEIFKRRSDKYARKALYHAAEHQDESEVKALLDDGILDIMHDGRTVLNSAVKTLSEDGMTTLLVCGVDPNTADKRGRTPLICATAGRHLSAIRALLRCDSVDVNRSWIHGGFAVLHLAVSRRDIDVLRLLLTCPRIAVNQVLTGEREELEREQQLVPLLREIYDAGRGGWAPLHWAVNGGDPTIIKSLLDDERVDVNLDSGLGDTALGFAVRRDKTLAVDMLLAHPKINVQQEDGVSILYQAIFYAGRSTIKLLLESSKIDVNSPNIHGGTALHLAVNSGKAHIIPILLGCKEIEVGALDSEGRSARDLALPYYPEIARALSAREILGYNRLDYLDLAIESGLDYSEWQYRGELLNDFWWRC